MNLAFDTLAYSKKLREAGFTESQAEAQAVALAEIVDEKLATKQDLKEAEISLRRDIKELEINLRHEMKEMESRIIIKLGSMMVVAVGLVATLVKLL